LPSSLPFFSLLPGVAGLDYTEVYWLGPERFLLLEVLFLGVSSPTGYRVAFLLFQGLFIQTIFYISSNSDYLQYLVRLVVSSQSYLVFDLVVQAFVELIYRYFVILSCFCLKLLELGSIVYNRTCLAEYYQFSSSPSLFS
jgi:hypothetical protein